MKKANANDSPETGGPEGGRDPEALDRQRVLGARLRTLFDDVVDEAVPEDFMTLLNKLDEGSGSAG